MSILEIKGLSHMYDNKVLFENANLTINNGDHAGIVGLNGAGKSTFINIIAGLKTQDAGEVNWLNGIRWGYLDQHADIDRSLSVMDYLRTSFGYLYEINDRLEALYAEMAIETDMDKLDKLINKSGRLQDQLDHNDFYDLDSRIKKVANGLGINNYGYDTIIKKLSGGQRAKLVLAKLLLENLDIMLLDEPTNFLDVEHIDWIINYLNSFEGTFMVISHDTSFLNKICRYVVNIENGEIRKYTGNYEQFMAQREQNAKQYAESYVRQQREIEKMQEYIAKNKARAATAGMANSRKKMLDKIDIMKKPVTALEAHFDFPYISLNTKDMVILKDLEIGYNKRLLPPINLTMSSQSKLWIKGTNGIGKSTLLKTIMGIIPSLGGKYHFHIASKIAYLEQDLEFNNSSINAMLYINEMFPKFNQKQQRSELAKVGIRGDLALKPIHNLSGGEQVRIRISTLMNTPSNILILDEPTNHLDINAKDSLMTALKDYEGALILVSHEADFASAVCNDIFDIKG